MEERIATNDTWFSGPAITSVITRLGVTALICVLFTWQLHDNSADRKKESEALLLQIQTNREEAVKLRAEIWTLFRDERDHDTKERETTRQAIRDLILEMKKLRPPKPDPEDENATGNLLRFPRVRFGHPAAIRPSDS